MLDSENITKLVTPCALLLCLLVVTGCAKIGLFRSDRAFDDFVIVRVGAWDSLSSLAARYLDDPAKDWMIAEFNDIKSLRRGQEIIIPLSPFEMGGLKPNGYQTVPVLVYQRFSSTKADKTIVTAAAFDEQMKFLKENGYRVITLDQLMDFLEFKAQIPQKSVAITIDGGWRCVYDIAFPILKKYGYPATLFVYTDFIGGQKALSWEQIREMTENRLDIECNTKTHRNMKKPLEKESFKDYFDNLQAEISESKKLIKQKMDKDCKYLAYPYGETSPLVIALLKKHGYRGAFTLRQGSNPFFVDNYKINRSMIYGNYDIREFEKNLAEFSERSLK